MKQLFQIFTSSKTNELNSIIDEVSILKESARTLFSQSEGLKKLVANVNSSIEHSSSASHEISSTVEDTAEAALDLEKTAKDSFNAMERSTVARKASNVLMENVVQSVEELQESVKSGLTEISSIATTMSQIQQKTNMINDIVFQTKLLSFNASVEAARAGESGKGFSVVAEEMAKLAKASGAAAKEIESIISLGMSQTQSQIKAVTEDLNLAAQKTSSSFKEFNSKRSEITQIFSELSEVSRLTNEKSQQISTATKEQDLVVKEINSAFKSLETNSAELEKMAENNHNSFIKLSELVESITNRIEKIALNSGIDISKNSDKF